MDFPIEGASLCPQCDSEERVGAQYIQELKDQNKLPADAYPNGLMIPVPFVDVLRSKVLPLRPEVPQLEMYFDVCAACFTLYCTGMGLRMVPVQTHSPGPTPQFRGQN